MYWSSVLNRGTRDGRIPSTRKGQVGMQNEGTLARYWTSGVRDAARYQY
jgi:hypothetical protein